AAQGSRVWGGGDRLREGDGARARPQGRADRQLARGRAGVVRGARASRSVRGGGRRESGGRRAFGRGDEWSAARVRGCQRRRRADGPPALPQDALAILLGGAGLAPPWGTSDVQGVLDRGRARDRRSARLGVLN